MDTNLPPSTPPETPTPPPLLSPPRLAPARPPSRGRGWRVTAIILGCLLVITLVFNPLHFARLLLRGSTAPTRAAGPRLEESIVEDNDSQNKIALVEVQGVITSDLLERGNYGMVDFVKDQLKMAAQDDRVKAVLLKVNSPGGEVLAADEISSAISKFQKDSGKPVIVSMASLAASGGYYIAAPCRWIVANELTITGSIGVIMHTYNYRGLMNIVGLRPLVYKSGRYKDMLSGEKDLDKLSPQEKEDMQAEEKMVKDLINETFDKFKSVVSEGRQQASKKNQQNTDSKGQELDKNWADYADGRILSGKEAYELGFVDELGNFDAAVKRARKLAKIESANLVQYQQAFDISTLFRLLGKTEAPKIKIDIGAEVPKLKAGQLYFLAPNFAH
jgi:protease-4